MADEELKVVVPPVVEEVQPESETPPVVVSPQEESARLKGWVPQDEWKGDPEAWRPAKEFLDRGELIGKIMAQGRELDQLKAAVNHMSVQQQKAYVAGYQNAIAQLKQQRDAALDDGDVRTAARISDKLDEVKEQAKQAAQAVRQSTPTPAQSVSPTFQQWHVNNPWYMQDRTLTLFAEAAGVAYKQEHPNSSELELLEAVTSEVKKEFGHRFQSKTAPNPDGQGRQASGQSTPRSSTSAVEASMTPQQKDIMRTILRVTPGLTKEQYLKEFNR